MKNLIKFTFLLLLIHCWACGKYEVQYEGPYDPEAQQGGNTVEDTAVVAFIASGNLFVSPRALLNYKVIDNSGTVTHVAMSDDHSKLAYKRRNEEIRLYNLEEEEVTASVSNTANVDWFDWHANNETLYFLEDGIISTFGPSIPIAVTDLNDVGWVATSGKYINSVAITEDGAVIWQSNIDAISFRLRTLYFYYAQGVFREVELGSVSPYQKFRLGHDQDVVWASDDTSPVERIHAYNIETGDRIRTINDAVAGSPGGDRYGFPDVYVEGSILYYGNEWISMGLGNLTDIDN
ncbi:MAG: hypothetical protein AAFP19_15315 [Bacteroidota bacterium]